VRVGIYFKYCEGVMERERKDSGGRLNGITYLTVQLSIRRLVNLMMSIGGYGVSCLAFMINLAMNVSNVDLSSFGQLSSANTQGNRLLILISVVLHPLLLTLTPEENPCRRQANLQRNRTVRLSLQGLLSLSGALLQVLLTGALLAQGGNMQYSR